VDLIPEAAETADPGNGLEVKRISSLNLFQLNTSEQSIPDAGWDKLRINREDAHHVKAASSRLKPVFSKLQATACPHNFLRTMRHEKPTWPSIHSISHIFWNASGTLYAKPMGSTGAIPSAVSIPAFRIIAMWMRPQWISEES